MISSLDYNIVMMPHVKFGFVLFVILALTLLIFSGWFSFDVIWLINQGTLSDWLLIMTNHIMVQNENHLKWRNSNCRQRLEVYSSWHTFFSWFIHSLKKWLAEVTTAENFKLVYTLNKTYSNIKWMNYYLQCILASKNPGLVTKLAAKPIKWPGVNAT